MAPSPMKEKESKSPLQKNIAGVLREFGPYLTLGFQLAVAVAVFLLLGIWLDGRFSTSPLWTLVGLAVGIAGGFIKFFKAVSEMEENEKQGGPPSHA